MGRSFGASHPGGISWVAPVPYCPGLMSHAPLISVALTSAAEGSNPSGAAAEALVIELSLACHPSTKYWRTRTAAPAVSGLAIEVPPSVR